MLHKGLSPTSPGCPPILAIRKATGSVNRISIVQAGSPLVLSYIDVFYVREGNFYHQRNVSADVMLLLLVAQT